MAFSSLRVRLIVLVLLAIIPPIAGVLYFAFEWRRHETIHAHEHALQLARHASAIHERLIEESRESVVNIKAMRSYAAHPLAPRA